MKRILIVIFLVLPLIGKLLLLRSVYAKTIGCDSYYELCSEKTNEETVAL